MGLPFFVSFRFLIQGAIYFDTAPSFISDFIKKRRLIRLFFIYYSKIILWTVS